MHGVFGAAPAQSRKATDRLADQMVSNDDMWFENICRALLPKDAGLALHITTGFEERTCYRYAAGDRKPPAYFLRALLRSQQGWQWLSAVMDGSNVEWFGELQRARRIAEAIKKVE